MTHILSPDEINALLNANATGEADPSEITAEKQRKITIHDFRRPDKFTKDMMRTLLILHDLFARLVKDHLNKTLPANVDVHASSVDQLCYEEFLRSIPNPSLCAVFDLNRYGAAVLNIDPVISHAFIDILMGGRGDYTICREHNKIEIQILHKIICEFSSCIYESWKSFAECKPELCKIETNPQFVRIGAPNEMAVNIVFTVKTGTVEGSMRLCIPYSVIEPFKENLCAANRFNNKKEDVEGSIADSINKTILKRYAMYRHAVGNMSRDEINNIKTGDILPVNNMECTEFKYECNVLKKEQLHG